MKESQRPVYRLAARHAFYDLRTFLWREWAEGAVINNPAEIELLIAHNAPIERINP